MQEHGLFVLILVFVSYGVLEARNRYPKEHILKTIKGENGDVIDCLNIYKQSALDHPLLKNHSIEISTKISSTMKITQIWQRSGRCPRGTIPVLRSPRQKLPRTSFLRSYHPEDVIATGALEIAAAHSYEGLYRGAKAYIFIWNPHVEFNEFSFGNVVVYGTGDSDFERNKPPKKIANLVATGWAVYPALFGDSKTRYFVYWTQDNGISTGCFNLECPGFVQISNSIALGAAFDNVSTYGGANFYYLFALFVDQIEERWYAIMDGERIGYWPLKVFNKFWDADAIMWGGMILNNQPDMSPTSTQMGSGHFTNEGDLNVAKMLNAHPVYKDGIGPHFSPSAIVQTNDRCYNLTLLEKPHDTPGFDFLYGGPGAGSPECQ